MKQKRFLNSPSLYWAFTVAIVSMLTMSSCGLFKSVNSQTTTNKGKDDVPTSYGNKPKPGAPTTPNEVARMGYIDRFKRIAISEMERTGVPASIKLAQGLLESDAGRSKLAGSYNNHFGIKCHSDWQGERYYQEDDDKDPLTGQLIKSCFRAYKNPDESFVAHSEFLRDPRKVNRYGFLFQLPKTDYHGWAEGLQRAGYATADTYSGKLIGLIEDYQLAQYDNYSLKDVMQNTTNVGNTNTGSNNGATTTNGGTSRPNDDFPTSGFPNSNSGKQQGNNNQQNPNNQQPNNNSSNNNNSWLPGWDSAKSTDPTETAQKPQDTEGVRNETKYARAYGNMTPYEVAGKYGISIANLQTYNEELADPQGHLPEGTVVYLQKKRNYWHGKEKTYRVRDCETMYDVSQKFGIKLSKLYAKNEMRPGEQPAIGQIIMLRRGWFEGADKPALRDTFGEWRRCKMEDPTNNPSVVNGNPTANPGGTGTGLFDITPNPSNPNQPTNGNPTTTAPVYTSTDVVTTSPTSPTTTTYPTTSYPTTSYPTTSYPTTTYPTTTTSSRPSSTYKPQAPAAGKPQAKPQAPPAGRPVVTTPARPATPATTPARPTPTPVKPATTTTVPAAASTSGYHTVAPKETLWGISRIYNTTVDKLKALNGLPDNNIKIGQQLRVK